MPNTMNRSRETIFYDIYIHRTSDEQGLRIVRALNKHSAIMASLDNRNYALAMLLLGDALIAGDLTQEDHDYVALYMRENIPYEEFIVICEKSMYDQIPE
jgi:hypothetical protein